MQYGIRRQLLLLIVNSDVFVRNAGWSYVLHLHPDSILHGPLSVGPRKRAPLNVPRNAGDLELNRVKGKQVK